MRVLFMGTPAFAVPCLEMLIDEKYDVVGVVTQPDKPKGRGKKLTAPPVKEYAQSKGIAVYQPSTLKNNAFEATLASTNPDVIVVVAYGKILPKYILSYPDNGCINVHASLLPKYRGAGPIQWSVINGDTETGITTMYMDEGLDTGDMILKIKVLINPSETAGDLHDKLSIVGGSTLRETLALIAQGNAPRTPQSDIKASYAPMLDKNIGKIDWHKPANQIHNLIRGVNPWPTAYTYYKGEMMKIWRASIENSNEKESPGTILKHVPKQGLVVQAGNESLILIQEVQFKGGKRMGIDDYLRGNNIQCGEKLE